MTGTYAKNFFNGYSLETTGTPTKQRFLLRASTTAGAM
jgi:hypothetical protein